MKPVVAITSDFDSGRQKGNRKRSEPTYFLRVRYAKAIQDLGGIPVIIPPVEGATFQNRVLEGVDGLLITGSGSDLDPALYGEKKRARFELMDSRRARFELGAVRRALRCNQPVLGICGGLQILGIALGGSLIQDIPTQMPEAIRHQTKTASRKDGHPVRITRGTKLYGILRKTTIRVNSAHHQALLRIPRGLMVNAVAPDGIIEGLESSNHRFVIGVQWHPEILYQKDDASRKLFRRFLVECVRYREAG